jgi:hypothetical protein
MKRRFKIFLACREAADLEKRTRLWRRAFRDYCRMESSRIGEAALRARGLRLYAAWATPQPPDRIERAVALPWESLEKTRSS